MGFSMSSMGSLMPIVCTTILQAFVALAGRMPQAQPPRLRRGRCRLEPRCQGESLLRGAPFSEAAVLALVVPLFARLLSLHVGALLVIQLGLLRAEAVELDDSAVDVDVFTASRSQSPGE